MGKVFDASNARGRKDRSPGVDIGLQLWTVRELLATDPKAILKAVAEIGYRSVQCDPATAEQHQETLGDLGLPVSSMYVGGNTVNQADDAKIDRTVNAVAERGVHYLIAHSPPAYLNSTKTAGRSKGDAALFYRQYAGVLKRWGLACRKNGIQLGFHAHAAEYEPLVDKTALEILESELSSEEMVFEVDVLWTNMGGRDPVRVIAEYGPRCRSVHFRDRRAGVKDSYDSNALLRSRSNVSVPIGDGILDIAAVMKEARRVGAMEWLVEQDFFDNDPVEELRRSYRYIVSAVPAGA
ncbi:MAG: sugar phosphate isomerase/epimerase [Kiritimatiellae bacterium]|nr:sugar phosphate isomerase/epimerase [Kiritimatiellia bacterium]